MHRFELIQATGIDDNSSASYPLIRRESYYISKVLIALWRTFYSKGFTWQFQNFAQLFLWTALTIRYLVFRGTSSSSNLFSSSGDDQWSAVQSMDPRTKPRNTSFSSQLLSPIPQNVKDPSISERTALFCACEEVKKKKKTEKKQLFRMFQNVERAHHWREPRERSIIPRHRCGMVRAGRHNLFARLDIEKL